MDLHAATRLPLTYSEVGATSERLPAGYQHIRRCAAIGRSRSFFEDAGDKVLHWGMQRGAGLRVAATTPVANVGTTLVMRLGPLPVPCRVVYVLDEPQRRGFAYGTLRGHPETGEELFSVRIDPVDDTVYAEVIAFSRPATWWSKAGKPLAMVAQRFVTNRYLRALR